MSINILDLVKDQVTGSLAKQASEFLGESESGVAKALGGMMPAILGGVVEKASKPSGAQGIMDMIGGLDLGGLSDIAGIFGGGANSVNNVMNSGGGILESLLGSKTSGIIDFIAGMAGLKKDSTSSLLKMAAPLLMGVLGRQVKDKGLSFLTDLIMGQKKHVADAMPSGLGNILGFSALGDLGNKAAGVANTASATVRNTASNVSNTTKEAASSGMGWLKWLLPLLLLAGLAWYLLKGKGGEAVSSATEAVTETVQDAANKVGDVVGDAVAMTSDMAKKAFANVDATAKAALDKITFTAGSAGESMNNYIKNGFAGDPVFRFNNLNFATGSADLDDAARAEVDQIAAILKAYPDVKVEVHGHTDNTGSADDNKVLSSSRAGAVMGRLIAQGVGGNRVKAIGYGQERPVADNGTEEGRAQNRRIEVKIVQ